jgi:hypothetical protein
MTRGTTASSGQEVYGRLFPTITRGATRIIAPVEAGPAVEALAQLCGYLRDRLATLVASPSIHPRAAIDEGTSLRAATPIASVGN